MSGQLSPEATAKNLLRRVLPETQWEQFNERETFEIAGSRGTYCISTHDLTRILDPQTRRTRARACLQLTVPAPVHDRIIAEYLVIRNDEDVYWRTANIFPADLDNGLFEFMVALLDVLLLVLVFGQLHG
jgi:hypothetical protein